MKKTSMKLLACLLALGMLLPAAACKLDDNAANPTETDTSAAADADGEAVAVSIGDGKYTITRSEVEDMYNNMVMQYSYFGMAAPTADADIESMQDSVVEMLAGDKVLLYQAELMGVTLDKNAQDGVYADVEDELAGISADFKAQAESEGAADVEARTKEIFNEQLQAAGLDMDVDGYRAYLTDIMEQEALRTALENKVKSDVTATEAEAKAYYDDLLATQKETYTANPEHYLDDQESYEKFGGDPILVTPEGYIRVRSVTVAPTEEIGEEYATLSTEMGTLEAEYGKLVLTNATANAKRISEIKAEYAEKKAKSDELREAYISGAREKADAAYKALTDGKAFDEVIKEFGQDEVYTTYPSFLNTGLLMQKGVATSTWPQALVDAVDTLEKGAYTKVINLDDSFYILELVGDEPAGETPYGDVEEEMQRRAAETAAETLWQETQEGWLGDPSIVTFHEDVYRSVGKAVG